MKEEGVETAGAHLFGEEETVEDLSHPYGTDHPSVGMTHLVTGNQVRIEVPHLPCWAEKHLNLTTHSDHIELLNPLLQHQQ